MNTEAPRDEVAASQAAPEASEAPKPRRRTRKTADSDGSPAPEASSDQPRPKRTRARRAKPKAADEQAPESAEVLQARALAQVSQASVVRRQRKQAERAAELLAQAGERGGSDAAFASASASEGAPAPASAPTAPGRAASGHVAVPAAPKAPAAAPAPAEAAAADASASAAAPARGRTADPEVSPADKKPVAPEQIVIPFVDPALRPHRRGRKPKAYVEAEKAAAAALAAAQAAAKAAAGEGEPVAGDAPAPVADVRPGRKARARTDGAAEGRGHEGSSEKGSERPGRKARQDKRDDAKREDARRDDGKRDDRSGKQGREHAERPGRDGKSDRRGQRQQNQNQRNKRGRNAPIEPSLTRDELTAMKVAELRTKAKELDIDVAGKKKAELVEEVYAAAARAEGFREIEGILDITNEGFGYIRAHGFMPSRDDAFVAANLIRGARLRSGDLIGGTLRPARVNDKFPGLVKLRSVNGMDPEQIRQRPKFSDLTPIYPNEPLKMECGRDSITGRAIDIVSPIGKGQRGLIVSPPKAGKTTILKKICQSIAVNNPEVHLICLLVDERPEEVTDMQRSIKGDVVASTFDMPADNHTRVSELVIERAKRIVEMGGDVVVVLDSITRLARAYNLAAPASGRILSGGVDSAALYPPKRFLGAARNIENGGSLTILASALIDTGSKMDEVIFEEFKGTGNMELKLDRDLADRRIFPAIDPVASGTRNEDLLVDEQMRPFVWGIRRILANMNNTERAAASFIKGLKGTNSNQEFLIRTAKKAADHEASL